MPQSGNSSFSRPGGDLIRHLRPRFWAESVTGTLTGLLFVLTFFWRDWIEAVFQVDPDHHNGSLEWLIVAVLGAITASLFLLARVEWRRAATALLATDA
jgi:tetrahydromethanopterin S-methyltransferase subunit E